ncbi:MAG TPA: class I SAM-dependent methyltransferase [Acidimicrobiia bacterium]|nr:class I SAM-dependent methyltransferase [Acidimicrobiia bacterium]
MPGPFHPTAHLYDRAYAHLDYPGHASTVEEIILARNPGAASLLDVACGTGKHLEIWRDRFEVEGLDIDPSMLDLARARVPEVPLHLGDFADFELDATFDAITCLFSSIGYAHTPDRLDAAIATMARHLAPGGVLVVEPWLTPEKIRPPWVRLHTSEGDDWVLARTSRMRYDADAGVSDMEFHYVVTTMEGTETIVERHVMGVHPPGLLVAAAERAGLRAEFDPVGTYLERGLLIAIR